MNNMKVRAAVVGYGNIGKYVLQAIAASGDIECAGILRRSLGGRDTAVVDGCKAVTDIALLDQVDVAILAVPSRMVPEYARLFLSRGINTVDCFDIHSEIAALRSSLSPVAVKSGAVGIIAAGWDPGTDSIVRAMLTGMMPEGTSYTNFGPGRSMGHSVVAASKPGVVKALSMTIPAGEGVHRREVYVELEPGADPEAVADSIKSDSYFINDETSVTVVDSVDALDTHMHGVKLERSGSSGCTDGQRAEFNMRINNPALTAQVLVMAARASMRQMPGCYTMIEVPVIDYLPGERETLIKQLV